MFRKIAAVLLLILGIASAAYGYHVYTHPVSLGSCAEVQNGELKQENEGQLVFTKGELSFSKGAYDPFFGIQTDSLILIRTVEMYQRMEKDISTGEVTEGFSTEHEVLTSYGLQNPNFPDYLTSEVFTAESIKIGEELVLSSEYAEKLALDSYSDLTGDYPLEDYTDLPYLQIGSPELGTYSGFYATPHSGWEIGDLRISFRTLDGASLGEFTVVGRQKGGALVMDGDRCSIYDTDISAEDLFPSLKGAAKTVFILLLCAGTVLILLSLILFFSRGKKYRRKRPFRSC
jgi:hypothetical protein